MRNVKVVFEYDGTDYCGFQVQNGVETIQGHIEHALAKIDKAIIRVYGAGRTDTGVHAKGQVVNFHTEGTVPIDRYCVALNSRLPENIVAVRAEEVPPGFHSRYWAKSRLYRYEILNRNAPSALECRFSWHIVRALDFEAMSRAAQLLVGVNDYTSFACSDSENDCFVREIKELVVSRDGDRIAIEIRANAFLRSMVRVIVGTLVEIGLSKRSSQDISKILLGKDRSLAGITAPPQGLCLMEVEY